jgi:multiple sugar transport system permease protein
LGFFYKWAAAHYDEGLPPPAVMTNRARAERAYLWFMLPSAIVIAGVLLYPLGYAIWLSFFGSVVSTGASPFVGLANYAALLADPRFWWSLVHTVLIVGASVALQFVVGFAVAFGLYRLARGATTIATLAFIPHIVTPVVGALFLRWMFAGRWGLVDGVLMSLGLPSPNWLGDPFWATVTVILADSWRFMPFMMLVLYAGLQSLDTGVLEAAAVDGASGWALLRNVIFPLMKPIILFVLVIRTMDAIRFFDIIYVLTGGGPGTATETITLYTYALGFRNLEIGKAAALGVLTLILVGVLLMGLVRAMYRRERGAF